MTCFVEWFHGYEPHFGIVHVDYGTLVRAPKQSAYYFHDAFIKRRNGSR